MSFKDYYKILEVSPAATYAEIKKSYRRLALQFHPDKNFGNQLYEAKFREIQEAYQVLSDLKKRNDYNTQRSYQAESEKKKSYQQVTPQTILNQTIDFRKKIAVLDPDRMNKLALFYGRLHQLRYFTVYVCHEATPTYPFSCSRSADPGAPGLFDSCSLPDPSEGTETGP